MSNMGLEIALRESGIKMLRAPVGDKYVLEEMQKTGAVLGGEQSGHIILSREATTGDGLLTAIRVLEIVAASGRSLAELVSGLKVFPQTIKNVRVKEKRPLEQLPRSHDSHRAGGARAERQWPRERALFRHGITGARDGGSGNGRDGPAHCRRDCRGAWNPPLDWVCLLPIELVPPRKKRLSRKAVILVLILLAAFAFVPMLRSALRSGVGIAAGVVYVLCLSVCSRDAAAHVFCAGALRIFSLSPAVSARVAHQSHPQCSVI